jgi:hypothetical protein
MNPGGDAAEQVVRLSLEGVEVAARISGNGAKNIALLLYATLKQEQKTKGKARLTSMLKSGKELKVYTITQKDLAKFSQEAKRYGVLYCVLKDRKNTDPNAAVDVIARAEDASKIQRITERFKLATVNRADVTVDIQREKEKVFPKDKSIKEALKGDDPEEPQVNPSLAKTDRDRPSEPNSTQASRSTGFPGKTERPSVREKLEVYKADIAREKAERARQLAKDVVSRGADAAKEAAKAVPVPKAPGRDR